MLREKSASTSALLGDDGFSLVEVVVALALLALAASVFFDVVSSSFRNTTVAARQAEAQALVRSLLATVGTVQTLQPGQSNGDENGLRWRIQIEPYGDEQEQKEWPVAAYKVTADVRWDDGLQTRSTAATTLRLGPKP